MSRKIDPQLFGNASMMATDLLNGISYYPEQIREVLARAYVELLELVTREREARQAIDDLPVPISMQHWRQVHARMLLDAKRCKHGVLDAADGRPVCLHCIHDDQKGE